MCTYVFVYVHVSGQPARAHIYAACSHGTKGATATPGPPMVHARPAAMTSEKSVQDFNLILARPTRAYKKLVSQTRADFNEKGLL